MKILFTILNRRLINCIIIILGLSVFSQISAQPCSIIPSMSLTGGGTVCQGSTTNVQFHIIGGMPPWRITYAINGIVQPQILNVMTSPYTLTTGTSGTYTGIDVYDFNNCQGTIVGGPVSVSIIQQPVVDAGEDVRICNYGPVYLNGFAQNYSSIVWTSTGNGTFSDPNSLTSLYFPGQSNISSGSSVLTLTVTPIAPCTNTVSDQVVILISEGATANAGPDAVSCSTNPYTTLGSATLFSSVVWSSSGTGTFLNAGSLNAIYNPSLADLAAGNVTLTLTAYGTGDCLTIPDTDEMVLYLNSEPNANAGTPSVVCEGSSLLITDATGNNFTSVNWTTSGSGTFANNGTLSPTYVPSAADINAGIVMLTLTANPLPPCSVPATSTKIVNISRIPAVNAGVDGVICNATPFTINDAQVINYSTVLWTTSGTGSFSSANSINTTYLPSLGDVASGSVILTLTAFGDPNCNLSSSASRTLTIVSSPTIEAGTAGTVCENSTYTINDATAQNYNTILWTSNGTGSLTNAASLTPSYTPSHSDALIGSVILTMSATGNAPCNQIITDTHQLTIVALPVVNAGNNISVCNTDPVSITGASAQNYSSVSWTTSGSGTFTNPNNVNVTYIPSSGDVLNGSVILTLTINPLSPCVSSVSDNLILSIIPLPVANAGFDNTSCDGTYLVNGASATNYSSIVWTSSGTGIFLNPTTLTPTYTASAQDIMNGYVNLFITVQGQSPCNAQAVDFMKLTLPGLPVADAGIDASICEGSTFQITTATAANYGSLNWTTSGSGTFAFQNTLYALYTPSLADFVNGSVVLSLTASSAAPCITTDNDQMTLTFFHTPMAEAGPNATICENSSVTLNGTVINSNSFSWASSGDGTFANSGTLTPTYFPGTNDILTGSVTITLTAYPIGTCTSSTSDYVIITINKNPFVDAGSDKLSCDNIYTLVSADADSYGSLQWSTSGSGNFINGNSVNATYIASVNDVAAGNVTLTLTAVGIPPCSAVVSDQMVLTFTPVPTVFAGQDASTCGNTSYTIADASATNYTIITWVTSGTGSFSNSSDVNPTYYPSSSDFAAGFVTLSLTATGYNLCNLTATDQMVLFFNTYPVISAGVDMLSCGTYPVQITSATAINYSSLYWTHNGTGVIQGNTSVSPVYIPSQGDILTGQVTLTLHVIPNTPCSGEVTDFMVLNLQQGPVISAGTDITVCENQNIILTTASATNYVTLLWSTSGTGVFSNSTALNPAYTPSVADIAAGQVILTLSVTGVAPCSSVRSDDMILTLAPLPVANAGPDETICTNSYLLSQATAQNYSSLNWTTTGTGTFSNPSVVNTVYTPSLQDLTAGAVTLTLTVNSLSPCVSQVVDQMTLTIGQAVSADAGFDGATCGTSPFTVTTSSASQATTISWSSSGTGTFVNQNTLNPTYTPGANDVTLGYAILTMLVQGSAPCFDIISDDMLLEISAPATANAGSDAQICVGDNYTILNASATNYSTVSWTTSGSGIFVGGNTLAPTYIPSPDDYTSGSVILSILAIPESPCSSTSYDEMLLSFVNETSADAGPDAEICFGQNFIVTGASAPGATSISWASTGSGALLNANTLTPTYIPSNGDRIAGSVMLVITTTGSVPCFNTSTDFMTLTISSQPVGTPTITGPTEVCAGQQGIVYSVIPPLPYTNSYTWALPNGATIISGDNTASITVDFSISATSGNITVTPSSSCGSGNSGTLSVTVSLAPPIPGVITGPDEVCGNSTDVAYSILPLPDVLNYIWTVPVGATIVAGDNTESILVNFGSIGLTGNITVSTENSCGTSAPSVLQINILPAPSQPVITALGPVSFCQGGSVILSATPGFASYLWSNGMTTQNITVTQSGTYSVTVTDNSGCNSLPSNEITVNVSALESPDVTINGSTVICEGQSVVLTAESGFASYLWNTGATTQSITVTASGDYSVIVTDNIGCISLPSATISVTAYPLPPAPVINANGPTVLCFGQTVTLTAPAGYGGYLWSDGSTAQYITVGIAGDYYVQVIDQNGCTSASSNIITVQVLQLPLINAGPDASTCSSDNFTINGSVAVNCNNVYWTSSGSGSFNNPALINPTYIPSQNDLLNGSVVLTLTGYGCQDISDNMILSIIPAAIANNGGDQEICFEPTIISGITASGYSGFDWTVSSGSGILNNTSSLAPIYLPGAGDLAAGYVILTLTVYPISPCDEQVIINKRLNIHAAPIANAGIDEATCAGSQFMITTATATNYTSVQWSSSGTGSWINSNTLNPTYFPSNTDVTIGSVTLTLEASNAACPLSTDFMILTLQPEVMVNAGPDGSTCEGSSFNLSGASASMYSSVLWSTSGSGTFSDPTTVNPVYTPGLSDIATGNVQLTLTGQSAVPCNGNGTDVLNLTINKEPQAFAGVDGTICQGEQYNITDAIASNYSGIIWSTSGAGIFISGNTLTPTYIPSQLDILAGSVILSVVASNPPCADISDSQTLTIVPSATVEAGPDASICQTCSYTVSGAFVNNAISYTWTSTGTGTFTNITTLTPTYQPSAADIANGLVTLILTAESNNGCGNFSDQMVITIDQSPQLDFTWEGLCEDEPTNFIVQEILTPINSIAVWNWNFGDGFYSNIINPVHTFPATGSYTVTLTATDTLGNQTIVSHIVQINSLPISMFGIQTPNCFGSETQFLNLSSTENGYISQWVWNFGDGSPEETVVFPNDPNLTHIYASTGIYEVSLTVTNSFGCDNSYSNQISITPNPIANFFYSSSCQDMIVDFQDASSPNGAGNIASRNWDFGDPASGIFNYSNLANPQHVYSAPGTYIVTLYITNFNNCSDTITKTITAGVAPPVAFTWQASCVNTLTSFFTDPSVVNVNTIAGYLWNFGDGGQSTLQDPQHAYTVQGAYTVTLMITDTAGCINSISNIVNINGGPIAYFGFSEPNCLQTEMQFTDLSSSVQGYINTWEWDFGDGNTSIINFPNDPDVTHLYNLPGNYNVSLHVITSLGCEHTVTRMVNVIPNPVANFNYSSTCFGQPVVFNDLSQPNGGGQIINWDWNFGDPGSGTGNNSTLQNPTHIYSVPGTYIILLNITTSNSCSDTITRTITVNPPPVVDFISTNGCANDTVNFISSTFINISNTSSWLWNFGDGATSISPDPAHIYTLTGNYNVSLTITDFSGCSASVSHTVNVIQGPSSMFTYTTPGCSGNDVTFTDMSSAPGSPITSWLWDFGDGTSTTVNTPTNPDVTHAYVNSGNYSVSLTVTNLYGCDAVTANTITIVPGPTADFVYEAGCRETPVQFTDVTALNGGAPIIQWHWDFGDPASGTANTSNEQNPLHTFSSSGTFTVALISMNVSGCYDSITKQVTITTPSAVAFNYFTSCELQPVSFEPDATIMNIAEIVFWSWDFGDGSPASNLINPVHTYGMSGSYNVTLTVSNLDGCSSSTSELLNIATLPVAAFTASSTCSGNLTSFSDHSYVLTGEPIVSWGWSFGDANAVPGTDTSNLQNPVHLYRQTGLYDVTLTVTSASGCSKTTFKTIEVVPGPAASYSYITNACDNGNVVFRDESTSNLGAIQSWTWQFEPNYYSNLQNPQHTFTDLDSCYNVQLIIQDLLGCSDTTDQKVCVPAGLSVQIAQNSTCYGDSTYFAPLLIAPANDSLVSFAWNFDDPGSGYFNTSIMKNPVHYFANTGSFMVSLTAKDENNCETTIYSNVIIRPLPLPEFRFTAGSCDSTLYFTDLSNANGNTINTWIWNYGDGTIDTLHSSPANTSHFYSLTGTFKVTLTTITNQGCRNSYSLDIDKLPCIMAGFEPISNSICEKNTFTFADNSVCGNPISSWNWYFGDGNSISYSTYQPTVEHYFATYGTYDVSLIVTTVISGIAVSDTITRSVMILAAPAAEFSASDVCINSPTLFTDQSQVIQSQIKSWSWDFGDESSVTDSSTLANPTYKYPISGTYHPTLIVVNTFGCSDTISKQVDVHNFPNANFSFSLSCQNNTTQFTDLSDSVDSGLSQWWWMFKDSLNMLGLAGVQNPKFIFEKAGNYEVELMVVNGNGCADTVSKELTVYPKPTSAFSITENYENVQGRLMLTNASVGANEYYWYFGTGTASLETDPIVTFTDEGEYAISLISLNEFECPDTLTINYSMMFKGLWIPNAFSPNNPNAEVRLFKPVGVNLRSYLLEVYDTWGNLLWSTNKLDENGSPVEGWDGSYNNNLLPQDTYMWKAAAVFKDGSIWDGSSVGVSDNIAGKPFGMVHLIR